VAAPPEWIVLDIGSPTITDRHAACLAAQQARVLADGQAGIAIVARNAADLSRIPMGDVLRHLGSSVDPTRNLGSCWVHRTVNCQLISPPSTPVARRTLHRAARDEEDEDRDGTAGLLGSVTVALTAEAHGGMDEAFVRGFSRLLMQAQESSSDSDLED